jgi:hypothetical protein
MGRRLSSQKAPGLAEACRDYDLGSLAKENWDGRDVEKGAFGQGLLLPAGQARGQKADAL